MIKNILRKLLRQLGILTPIRKYRFYLYNKKYKKQFKGQKHFEVKINNCTTSFSVEDAFSAHFFALGFKNKIYEHDALNILLNELQGESVFVDVGANIGYFSCVIANCRPKCQVYAFEPGKENCKIMSKNIALNKLENIRLEQYAVTDISGKIHFQNSPVGNAVLKIIDKNSAGSEYIVMDAISLDDYFKKLNVQPDFVKIDVEGAEYKVLNGMKELFKNPIKVLVEVHSKELKNFNSSKEQLFLLIDELGLKWSYIENDDKKNPMILIRSSHS